jgi:hypothetical protein
MAHVSHPDALTHQREVWTDQPHVTVAWRISGRATSHRQEERSET